MTCCNWRNILIIRDSSANFNLYVPWMQTEVFLREDVPWMAHIDRQGVKFQTLGNVKGTSAEMVDFAVG